MPRGTALSGHALARAGTHCLGLLSPVPCLPLRALGLPSRTAELPRPDVPAPSSPVESGSLDAWVEVTADDRLPCLAGRLCFSRAREDRLGSPCWRRSMPGTPGHVMGRSVAGGGPGSRAPLWALRAPGWAGSRPETTALRLGPWAAIPLPCPHVTVRHGSIASRERAYVVLSSNPSETSFSVQLVLWGRAGRWEGVRRPARQACLRQRPGLPSLDALLVVVLKEAGSGGGPCGRREPLPLALPTGPGP